jgi:hypothetical protein
VTTAGQGIPSSPPEKGSEWEGENPLGWEANFWLVDLWMNVWEGYPTHNIAGFVYSNFASRVVHIARKLTVANQCTAWPWRTGSAYSVSWGESTAPSTMMRRQQRSRRLGAVATTASASRGDLPSSWTNSSRKLDLRSREKSGPDVSVLWTKIHFRAMVWLWLETASLKLI